VELRHVEHVHLAYKMKRDTQLVAALTLICVLRLCAGALLPLSADEAYYWLWSRHLAAGYFDHPPAIAWLIRAGTAVFGDTPFGVRIAGIVLSFGASWFVWRTGAILLAGEKAGALACLFFNLTLMTTVETLAATPDSPSVVAAAVFAWTLAKVVESGDGRWWLAAGAAAGVGLLSKYSALFLGVGALVWLLASPPMRRWLTSPWPYLGGLLAGAIFLPNIVWNAEHGWATFFFQFGRVGGTHFTLRYLAEFLGAQVVLATPFILVLGVMGLARASRTDERRALIGAMLWPAIVYFAWHSLHDRVQGNWPCFLYPFLAVAAADAATRTDWSRWRAPLAHWSSRLAVPVAAVLLIAGYAQALLGVVPLGRKDPLARLLAVGLPEVVTRIDTLRIDAGAEAILTSDYATAAWLSFYGRNPVVDIGEDYRWPDAPIPAAALLGKPALYVTEMRKDHHDILAAHFEHTTVVAHFDRFRKGVPIAHYVVYRVTGLKGRPPGRLL
jgi:4-amino-4-deoxy-L-arabinose transferase-like glycosyltransferase